MISERRRNYVLESHRRDALLEWIRKQLQASFQLNLMPTTAADTMADVEQLIEEYRENPEGSRLKEAVPSVRTFFTPLPLREAFEQFDLKYRITARRFVAPSFNELRKILNLAQLIALKDSLRLVTFDGDQTLYQDGGSLRDPKLCFMIQQLLRQGVYVALVTAAGYGFEAHRYAERLGHLFEKMQQDELPTEARQRFFVLGGECNYLLRLDDDCRLQPVRTEEWSPTVASWTDAEADEVLDVAQAVFQEVVEELSIRGRIIRKARAVGLIPGGEEAKLEKPLGSGSKQLQREHLDEAVLRAQHELRQRRVKLVHCAFNGGNDAWVDIGSKRVGVEGLLLYLGLAADQCLHVGDQFFNTGNDFAARDVCPCVWIRDPSETKYIMRSLLRAIGLEYRLPGALIASDDEDDDDSSSPQKKTGSRVTAGGTVVQPPVAPAHALQEASTSFSSSASSSAAAASAPATSDDT